MIDVSPSNYLGYRIIASYSQPSMFARLLPHHAQHGKLCKFSGALTDITHMGSYVVVRFHLDPEGSLHRLQPRLVRYLLDLRYRSHAS